MTAIIEWMKNLGVVVGLFVLIELGIFVGIIMFCLIREYFRARRKENDHT